MPTSFSWILSGTDLGAVRDRYLQALAALDEELAALDADDEREQATTGDAEPTSDGQG